MLHAKLGKPLDSTVTTIWEGERYTDTLTSQLQNSVLLDIHATIWHNVQIYFLIALVIGMAIFMIALRFFKEQGEKQSEDFHIRGFRLAPPKAKKKRGY
ncbi:hypothetical protein AKJ18_13570, partial [Vibrio xuii]